MTDSPFVRVLHEAEYRENRQLTGRYPHVGTYREFGETADGRAVVLFGCPEKSHSPRFALVFSCSPKDCGARRREPD